MIGRHDCRIGQKVFILTGTRQDTITPAIIRNTDGCRVWLMNCTNRKLEMRMETDVYLTEKEAAKRVKKSEKGE